MGFCSFDSVSLHTHIIYIYIYIHIYIYTYIHIHIYIYKYIYTDIYIYICIYIYIHTHIRMCIYIYMCVCVHACMHAYMHVYMHAYTVCLGHPILCMHFPPSPEKVAPAAAQDSPCFETSNLVFSCPGTKPRIGLCRFRAVEGSLNLKPKNQKP